MHTAPSDRPGAPNILFIKHDRAIHRVPRASPTPRDEIYDAARNFRRAAFSSRLVVSHSRARRVHRDLARVAG